MTRENPDYFEAVIVMREPGSRTARRVDVFQFAFDSDGTIGRIDVGRAPSDIDGAVSAGKFEVPAGVSRSTPRHDKRHRQQTLASF